MSLQVQRPSPSFLHTRPAPPEAALLFSSTRPDLEQVSPGRPGPSLQSLSTHQGGLGDFESRVE